MRQEIPITALAAVGIAGGHRSVARGVTDPRRSTTEGRVVCSWAVAAILAVLALAGPASAQDTSAHGDGVYAASGTEQDTAGGLTPSCGGDDSVLMAASTEPAVAMAAGRLTPSSSSTIYCPDGSAARCDGKKFWVELRNVHGAVLWRYYIGAQWCWNRGKVTKVRFNRWPQITGWGEFYGWEFAGHVSWSAYPHYIEPGKTYYPRTRSSAAHSIGKFRRCIHFGADYCWGERYGRLDVVVYGNGGYDYDPGV